MLARLQRREDFRLARGLQDQVDVGVGRKLVEADVAATADPALPGEQDPWSSWVGVEDVADLDLRDA